MKKIFVILAIICCSCATTENLEKDCPVIKLSNNFKDNDFQADYKVSNFVDSVEYILLETTNESLLGAYIEQLHIADQKIYIRSNGNLYMFDLDGKFIKQISTRGRGNGEYLSMNSLMFDDQNKQIMIFSGSNNCISFFDYQGKYIKKIDIDSKIIVRTMTNLPDGGFLCYSYDLQRDKMDESAPVGLWKIDAQGKYVRNYSLLDPLADANKYIAITVDPYSRLNKLFNGDVIISEGFLNDLYYYDAQKDTLTNFIDYQIADFRLEKSVHSDLENIRQTKEYYTLLFTAQIKGKYMLNHWNYPTFMTSIYNLETSDFVLVEDGTLDYDFPIVVQTKSYYTPNNLPDAIVVAATGPQISKYLSNASVPQEYKDVIISKLGGMN